MCTKLFAPVCPHCGKPDGIIRLDLVPGLTEVFTISAAGDTNCGDTEIVWDGLIATDKDGPRFRCKLCGKDCNKNQLLEASLRAGAWKAKDGPRCAERGRRMMLSDCGVSRHLDAGGEIDHDQDALHVAVAEELR